MGINETNFNPFNPGSYYSGQSGSAAGFSSDFNPFNPMGDGASGYYPSETKGASPFGYTSSGTVQGTDSFTRTTPKPPVKELYGIDKFNAMSEAERALIEISPDTRKQIDEVLTMTNTIEKELKNRYPKGVNLVGLGRSPSLLMEIFKAKGYDTKTCALSNLTSGEYDISGKYSYLKQLDTNDVKAYNEYLKELGLTPEKIKASPKPTVFVDYTRTGNSLRSFAELLKRPEIGIGHLDNVAFLSLNKDLMPNQTIADKALIDKFWEKLGIKNFSFAPRVNISEIGKAGEIVHNFKPAESAVKFLLQAIKVIKGRV